MELTLGKLYRAKRNFYCRTRRGNRIDKDTILLLIQKKETKPSTEIKTKFLHLSEEIYIIFGTPENGGALNDHVSSFLEKVDV